MKSLVCKKDFSLNGTYYIQGDVLNITDINVIKKLNEKGFIEPLTLRDLTILERELKNVNEKEASEDNDTREYREIKN